MMKRKSNKKNAPKENQLSKTSIMDVVHNENSIVASVNSPTQNQDEEDILSQIGPVMKKRKQHIQDYSQNVKRTRSKFFIVIKKTLYVYEIMYVL